MTLDCWVKVVQIVSYLGTTAAAVFAFFVYKSNARRERARWVESLYSRFFEEGELKRVRDILDCAADDADVEALVNKEGSDWTDYLNFFELVAYLQESKQLERQDVSALFDYYLGCLRRHRSTVSYIRDESKGFKYLRKLLF
jgi:hypothetical protein